MDSLLCTTIQHTAAAIVARVRSFMRCHSGSYSSSASGPSGISGGTAHIPTNDPMRNPNSQSSHGASAPFETPTVLYSIWHVSLRRQKSAVAPLTHTPVQPKKFLIEQSALVVVSFQKSTFS